MPEDRKIPTSHPDVLDSVPEMRPQLKIDEVSADFLIREYGDAAYRRGCKLALGALLSGDKLLCRALGAANIELRKRGYKE